MAELCCREVTQLQKSQQLSEDAVTAFYSLGHAMFCLDWNFGSCYFYVAIVLYMLLLV